VPGVGLVGRAGAGSCPNLLQRRPGPGSAARRSAEYQRFSSGAPARSGPLQQIRTNGAAGPLGRDLPWPPEPRDRSWSSWSGAGRTRPARERPSGKTPTGNPALAGDRPHRIDLSPRTTVLGEDASQTTVTAEMAFWEDRSPRFVGGARRFPHNSAVFADPLPGRRPNDPPGAPFPAPTPLPPAAAVTRSCRCFPRLSLPHLQVSET